jgi:hypothetical protein
LVSLSRVHRGPGRLLAKAEFILKTAVGLGKLLVILSTASTYEKLSVHPLGERRISGKSLFNKMKLMF